MFVRPKPLILTIIDGFGLAPDGPGNAIFQAKTPNLDKLIKNCSYGELAASGLNVGLPKNTDGNSEIGHTNIGAGRIVYSDVVRIDNSIKSGNFFKNDYLKGSIEHVKKTNGNVHIIGLVGEGKVHSSFKHLKAIIDFFKMKKFDGNKVFVHPITDGRDSDPFSAKRTLHKLDLYMKRARVGNIATVIGRLWAMDRDERWERTLKAYELYTENKGEVVDSWEEALDLSYSRDINDQYIEPFAVKNFDEDFPSIQKGDAIIFFNFRADRAIQLTRMFEDKYFEEVERKYISKLYFVGMTNYQKKLPKKAMYIKESVKEPLGSVLAKHRIRQFRIAETEKYPHVTYFLNGGREEPYAGEDRIELQSPKNVKTYDKAPTMRTPDLAKVTIQKIKEEKYDVIILNLAAADMVGHTGNMNATIKAIESCDKAIGDIAKHVLIRDGVMIITSDHGNSEEMYSKEDGMITKHSTNKVPFIVCRKDSPKRKIRSGILADVAPTILHLLGIEKPASMTGESLV